MTRDQIFGYALLAVVWGAMVLLSLYVLRIVFVLAVFVFRDLGRRRTRWLDQIHNTYQTDQDLNGELVKMLTSRSQLQSKILDARMTIIQEIAVIFAYLKMDFRAGKLLDKDIAQLERNAVFQQISEIEKMISDLMAKIPEKKRKGTIDGT